MRFNPPARAEVDAAVFDHPAFVGLAPFRDLLTGSEWPDLQVLQARLQPLRHHRTGAALALVAAESLAADGLHYEQRILQRGIIATRRHNWHDLFNALIWKRYPAIKSAMNVRQADGIAQVGRRLRTRAQQALTHFDEAGAVVIVRDLGLLELWDAHDWTGLFLHRREAWRDGGITLQVSGHALLEHALCPHRLLTAKALAILDAGDGRDSAGVDAGVAAAIAAPACLLDPQELRPMPLSGIPGWHDAPQDKEFYRDAPCFRPRRAERRYPPALMGSAAAACVAV
ncbi:MAG: DUF3025 domain-containing protein [Xanthomonadaceae bacterium]|nr:DUF3025 domain-containing protein [Xanthomonadaceae bacterium]MDE2244742.1 DUF3025 domain-containing protein [Xanthomonadaceae bacterium]